MIRGSERPGTKARIFAAGAVALAAVGLTACAAPSGAPAATPTTTLTQSAPASPAAAASSSTAASSGPAKGSNGTADTSSPGKLPEYQPSTVVSKSVYSTVLTSPDPVGEIGAFYQKALDTGGWHVVSTSMGPFHASFTAYRSNEGASISVYSRGRGSGISISTHPR
jgi:hypothetical protein